MKCMFSRTCKKFNTEDCTNHCYPYVMLHGLDGVGGFLASRNIPKRYEDNLIDNLPIKDSKVNKTMYDKLVRYSNDVINLVLNRRIGLYLFGGTGTGKTTAAITLLNEFLIARVRLHLKGELPITTNPVLFFRVAELQNTYNSMFRGGVETQEINSERYYAIKKKMKEVELLVLDDIALRECPEGFRNELFEIIDFRSAEGLTTFFTSNVKMENLSDYLGERIASRIEGMTSPIPLVGQDYRKGGNF